MEYLLPLFTSFCFITISGCLKSNADTAEELHCDIRELITCGNNKGLYSWAFCRARTQNTKRILSVHLDLRYPNRYCRSYGTPKNFGLTEPGDSMWVIHSCFGTFLLCLELEPPQTTTTVPVIVTTSNVQDFSRHERSDLAHAPNKEHIVSMPTVTILTGNMTHSTKESLTKSSRNNTARNGAVENIEIVLNEREGLDFTTKVIIIAAIATAGLCIMCLVATMGCVMMKRRESFDIKDGRQVEIEAESTTATSLPVSDCQDQEGIYNVIPFDEEGSVFEIEKLDTIPEERIQPHGDPDLHIYATFSRDQNRNKSFTNSDENEYDRLRNTPKVSVSDSSTYNRISDVYRDDEQQNVYDVCQNVRQINSDAGNRSN